MRKTTDKFAVPETSSDNPAYLADALKTATWPLHKRAETTGIVSDILKQRVSLHAYIHFVSNLAEIYGALEQSEEWLEHFTDLSPFMTPSLFRKTSLQNDLIALQNSAQHKAPVSILPETKAYCKNIASAHKDAPAAMLGHIYVRYLGDLNGGQVLQRLLGSYLNLKPSCLSFYAFPKISDLGGFRQGFRQALNGLILSPRARDTAIQTGLEAFSFNIDLSQAINECKQA